MAPIRRSTSLSAERPSLALRAAEDVRFIRATMERACERAADFTAVPGWGGVLMGCIALATAAAVARTTDRDERLALWLSSAFLAASIATIDMARKSRSKRTPLLFRAGSRFAASLLPGLFAGVCVTWLGYSEGFVERLPSLWLLCYGVSVVGAGSVSIRPVRWMGIGFLALGAAAVSSPAAWGNAYMAAGFGGLHVSFGLWIARHAHG